VAARRAKSRGPSKAEREFVSEAEEILERMREDLAELADRGASGAEAPPERVNALFRSAHSLKGLAGLFGFDPIRDLAHRLEDLLDALRLGRVGLDTGVLSRLDRAVKLFTELLGRVGDASALSALADPVASLAGELAEARAPAPPPPPGPFAGLMLDAALLSALTEYEEHRLRESLRLGRCVHLVESTFEIMSFEEGLAELTHGLRGIGEVLSTLPAPGEAALAQIRFSILFASDLSQEQVAASLELPGVSVRSVAPGRRGAAQATAAGPAPHAATAPAEAAGGESLKSLSETVRVDIRKLDELMNLVGELAIVREALAAQVVRLSAAGPTAREGALLARVHKQLDRRLRELQAAVLEVRMVPLRQVFEKVSRVVRRLRAELGRDVRLDLHGADTELDKLIVEELVDPLMHLVRNALDHAIEPPDERRAAGKPAQGQIRIDAFQRGNHVVITIADDGRGIDREALRASAEARGLVRPGEVLSERETLDLVFAPGLSTRSEVTDTSGRGVGMDVVRTNVALLGGAVDVESTPGRGTAISLTLPITLAIIQSLVVEAGGQRFAVPLGAVQETLLVEASQVLRSEGREILDLRGEPLLLRRLAAEFGLPAAPPEAKLFAVVLGIGEARLGLLVDRLESQQDAVVKPILGPVAAVRGIAGASELGGPQPVLVLDASALLADALSRREAA
jgi:two-component system chemotaxis sensor kinase CheA